MTDRAKLTANITHDVVELPDDKLALVARLVRTIVETERALGTARRIDAATLAARDRGESPAPPPPDLDVRHRGSVLAAISAEVDRAIALHGRAMPGGWGPSGRAEDRDAMIGAKRRCGEAQRRGDVTYRDVLGEEIAEVFAERPGSQLQRAELIQVAAVCTRWIEAIDMAVNERDPRLNPRAGDWLSSGRVDVRVDFIEGDSVFCVKWLPGEEEGYPFGIALTEFREQATGSVVIAEGLPGIEAAWVYGQVIEVWRR